jgi:hypothetical protein
VQAYLQRPAQHLALFVAVEQPRKAKIRPTNSPVSPCLPMLLSPDVSCVCSWVIAASGSSVALGIYRLAGAHDGGLPWHVRDPAYFPTRCSALASKSH